MTLSVNANALAYRGVGLSGIATGNVLPARGI